MLESAVRGDDVERTYALLQNERGGDAMAGRGYTLLLAAIAENAGNVLPLLVAAGADVNAPQGAPAMQPLVWAFLYGSSRDTVRRLIELGACVDEQVVKVARSAARASNADIVVAHRLRGCIGITPARGRAAELALLRADAPAGAPVLSVERYSAAERAGLRRHDVIASIDDAPIAVADDLVDALSLRWVGDCCRARIIRAGRTLDIDVELGPLPATQARVV